MNKILQKIKKLESFLSPNILGLDIGHTSIKFVELKRAFDGSLKVLNFGLENFNSKKEIPEETLILETIKEIKEKYQIQARNTILYTSLIQTFTHLILLPKIEKKELKKEKAIWWEAKKIIPWELQDIILNFEIVGTKTESDSAERLEILVSAVKKEEAVKIASLITEAELVPCGLMPWPLIARIFINRNYINEENQTVCFIDFGARSAKISFYQGRKFQLIREINIGGCNITEALTTPFSSEEGEICLEYSKARDLKFKYGLMLEEDKQSENRLDFKHFSILIRPVIEKLFAEIKRSIELFNHKYPEEQIAKIAIFGGGSLLKGLPKVLKDELKTDVIFLKTPLSVSGDVKCPQLANAYGLACGKGKGINLLPFKFKIARNVTYLKNAVKALFVFGFIFILIFLIVSASALIYYRRAIDARQAQLAALEPNIVKLQKLMDLKKEYEPNYRIYSKVITARPRLYYIFKEISLIVPRRIKFDFLQTEKSGGSFFLIMRGIVFANGLNTQQVLADFIENLEDSHLFSDVKLTSMSENSGYEVKAANFEISCRIITDY